MSDASIDQWLEDLKNPNPILRDRATAELWRVWFQQKGILGLERLQQNQLWLEAGNFEQAEAGLTELLTAMPDFAEAWNRRAVLYYLLKQYRKSLADCQQVIQLNPVHFGALHGLGLCHAALGEYAEAIQAFRKALEVQPYAVENQRWILECTAKLS